MPQLARALTPHIDSLPRRATPVGRPPFSDPLCHRLPIFRPCARIGDRRARAAVPPWLGRWTRIRPTISVAVGARNHRHQRCSVKVLSFEVDFALVRGQMNAKLQAQAMVLGSPVTYLDDEEARKAEANKPATIGRAWD